MAATANFSHVSSGNVVIPKPAFKTIAIDGAMADLIMQSLALNVMGKVAAGPGSPEHGLVAAIRDKFPEVADKYQHLQSVRDAHIDLSAPISPEEADRLEMPIPPEVFAAFNTLIVQEMGKSSACISQEAVIQLILKNCHEAIGNNTPSDILKKVSDRYQTKIISREMVFKHKWLGIEKAYMKRGWKVVYDKPGYNEDGGANFTFSKGK